MSFFFKTAYKPLATEEFRFTASANSEEGRAFPATNLDREAAKKSYHHPNVLNCLYMGNDEQYEKKKDRKS